MTAIPVPTAQQRTGTSAAASNAQPNGTRTSLQQTLPLNFYGPDMQAQIMAQKQAEQDALQLQQACARNAAVHAAAKAAYEAQVAAQQTAAALRQQALPAGPPPPTHRQRQPRQQHHYRAGYELYCQAYNRHKHNPSF